MGLDRRIELFRDTGGRNDAGRYVPSLTRIGAVWATRADDSLFRVIETQGTRGTLQRQWRIRWRRDVVTAPVTSLYVTDSGASYVLTNIHEDTGRRNEHRHRWLVLEGVARGGALEG